MSDDFICTLCVVIGYCLRLLYVGVVDPHQSMSKCRIVGFLVTQKDLVDPGSFLGVKMCEYLTRNVILPATTFSMS